MCRLFLGQVPIAVACGLLIASVLSPELEKYEDQGSETEDEETQGGLAFDFPGAVTLAIATASLLAAVDLNNSHSWEHPIVFGLLMTGLMSALAFICFEAFPGNRELLMPLRLLRTEIGAFCAGQVRQTVFTRSSLIFISVHLRIFGDISANADLRFSSLLLLVAMGYVLPTALQLIY